MLSLFGSGIGFKVAIGKAVVLGPVHHKFPKYKISTNQIEHESNRFQIALGTVSDKLDAIQKTVSDESSSDAKSFIDVHRLILKDPIISKQPIEFIKQNLVNTVNLFFVMMTNIIGVENIFLIIKQIVKKIELNLV